MTMSQPLPPGTYLLDPERTTIRADVKAMFGLMTVHGTFRLNGGQITIAEDPGAAHVRAVIDAGSFESGNKSRDNDVVSASLLDAKAYPEITFDGTGARQDGSAWLVDGSVTAHGSTVPAELRVTPGPADGGLVRFRATARLDRTSFGVTAKKGMVGRTADVVIEATARTAGANPAEASQT